MQGEGTLQAGRNLAATWVAATGAGCTMRSRRPCAGSHLVRVGVWVRVRVTVMVRVRVRVGVRVRVRDRVRELESY